MGLSAFILVKASRNLVMNLDFRELLGFFIMVDRWMGWKSCSSTDNRNLVSKARVCFIMDFSFRVYFLTQYWFFFKQQKHERRWEWKKRTGKKEIGMYGRCKEEGDLGNGQTPNIIYYWYISLISLSLLTIIDLTIAS